jgi:hypothetical protein
MQKIHMIITNANNGSNGIEWVLDDKVLEKIEYLVEDGVEQYMSDNGLQVTTLKFPDDFNIGEWLIVNDIDVTDMDSLDGNSD